MIITEIPEPPVYRSLKGLGLVLIGVAFLSCETNAKAPAGAPPPPKTVSLEKLRNVTRTVITDAAFERAGAPPPARIVSILSPSDETLLLVADAEPFVYELEVSGEGGRPTRVRGREGEGPGELRGPWAAQLHQGRLWIMDRNGLVEWELDSLEEVARHLRLDRMASLTACRDTLLGLYAGIDETEPSESMSYRTLRYGVAGFVDGEWWDRSDLNRPRSPLVLGNPEMKPLVTDSMLFMLNSQKQDVSALSCSGALRKRYRIPDLPERWRKSHLFGRGFAAEGDRLMALYSRTEVQDTTRATVWNAAGEVLATYVMEADFRIIDAGDDRDVWGILYTPEPVIVTASSKEILEALGR